jgi:uncharacterized protein YggL (DUF469 family)
MKDNFDVHKWNNQRRLAEANMDNLNRLGLIGISEFGKPKLSSEEEDERINKIIDNVKKTGKFTFNGSSNPDYKWLYRNSKIGDESKKEKFINVLKQIKELIGFEGEEEDERINRIIDNVKKTGEFTFNQGINPDYQWLSYNIKYNTKIKNESKKEKFINVLKQIKELIGFEEEDERINRIIDNVEKTGEFAFNGSRNPDFRWLYDKSKRGDESKKEKFINVLKQIKELIGFEEKDKDKDDKEEDERINRIIDNVKKTGEFTLQDNRSDYKWLYNNSIRGDESKKEKFINVLKQIAKIKKELGTAKEYWGEKTTKQVLEQMGFTDIPDLGQYKIDDCKNSLTCKKYKFDVYIPYNETNYNVIKNIPDAPELQQTGIIFEYDGIQHFKPSVFFGGDEEFKKRIYSDREKNSYCQNNKPNPIKLVRIPYTSKTRNDIERDVVSALKNSNTFVLTGNYPKEGWNK